MVKLLTILLNPLDNKICLNHPQAFSADSFDLQSYFLPHNYTPSSAQNHPYPSLPLPLPFPTPPFLSSTPPRFLLRLSLSIIESGISRTPPPSSPSPFSPSPLRQSHPLSFQVEGGMGDSPPRSLGG